MIAANVYCPNDHVESKIFLENVYDKMYEVMDRHADAFILADRLLLLKCYDIKTVKSPGFSSVGLPPCGEPTKKKKKKE